MKSLDFWKDFSIFVSLVALVCISFAFQDYFFAGCWMMAVICKIMARIEALEHPSK